MFGWTEKKKKKKKKKKKYIYIYIYIYIYNRLYIRCLMYFITVLFFSFLNHQLVGWTDRRTLQHFGFRGYSNVKYT